MGVMDPGNRHLFDLLVSAARTFPGKVAYAWQDGELTWDGILSLSRAVATCIGKAVPARSGAAVVMDGRSVFCVPAMMGVVGAGCFYALLDPNVPEARLRVLLDRFQPSIVLADRKGAQKVSGLGLKVPVLSCDDAFSTPCDMDLVGERCAQVLPEDLCMVLYTSGSTGLPKGAAHSHRSLLAWTDATARRYGITERTVLANQSPWFYANSLLELFVPMQTGARVEMVPPSCLSFPRQFPAFLRQKKISELCMTPSSFAAAADANVLAPSSLPDLRLMILSGEAAPAKQMRQWMEAAPGAAVMNFYGSTETLSVAVGPLRFPSASAPAPVGPLFPGVTLKLLREDGCLAAPGESGQILVRSPWITRGYYRDPALTRQVLPPEEGWFHTGDLGRMAPDGSLTVLGRMDSMIKHRGYRMEPGEVEAAALACPGCREARCLPDTDRGDLCCFVSGPVTEAEIRAHLRRHLPRYMLPDRYFVLPALPRSANGKTDLARLRALLAGKSAPDV